VFFVDSLQNYYKYLTYANKFFDIPVFEDKLFKIYGIMNLRTCKIFKKRTLGLSTLIFMLFNTKSCSQYR